MHEAYRMQCCSKHFTRGPRLPTAAAREKLLVVVEDKEREKTEGETTMSGEESDTVLVSCVLLTSCHTSWLYLIDLVWIRSRRRLRPRETSSLLTITPQ